METAYQRNRARRLSKAIASMKGPRAYLDSKKQRGDLADLLKQVISIESAYPPKIISMTNGTATMLYKRVSDTCSACVNKKDMQKFITLAIRDLNTYNTKLIEWLGGTFEQEESKSVHELRPTIK